MGKEIQTELGRLSVSDDVIATLAALATTECPGVVGMASGRLQDGIAELLGRENLSRGVRVHTDGDGVEIDLYVVVGYGTRIAEIARTVTQRVRDAVEPATGLQVRAVRINVQGVRIAGLV